MKELISDPAAFLKYGPIGFAALILLAIILTLSLQNSADRKSTIHLIVWVALIVYAIGSAGLAFSDYTKSIETQISLDAQKDLLAERQQQNEILREAIADIRAGIQSAQRTASLVVNSCPGGSGGRSPANMADINRAANDAVNKLNDASNKISSTL